MSKTPYEVRLEILKMAQDQANSKYYSQCEQVYRKEGKEAAGTLSAEMPKFPAAEEILAEAAKLKSFVDQG
jgi:hypothetical protein